MIYFVYPYKKSDWEELRYSLRSLQQNISEEFSVIVIGDDKPDWLKPEYFRLIDPSDSEDPYIRVGRAYTWIIRNLDASFFLCADDQYLLQPSTINDLKRVYFLEDLRYTERPTGELSIWQSKLWDTIDVLRDMCYRNIYNYATHIPQYMSPIFIRYIWSEFDFEGGRHLLTQAYYNCREIYDPLPLIPLTIKAGFYGGFKPKISPQHIWLNHNDEGLDDKLKTYITDQFSQPSIFEEG